MIEVWGSATTGQLQTVQVMQNRALRNVFDIPYLTPRFHIYSNLSRGILPVKALYELAVSKFVFKVVKNISSSEVSFATASHLYQSRHCGQLTRPRCRTQGSKRRISYSGPMIYNSLPQYVKNSRGLIQFKFAVKKHLSSNHQISRWFS